MYEFVKAKFLANITNDHVCAHCKNIRVILTLVMVASVAFSILLWFPTTCTCVYTTRGIKRQILRRILLSEVNNKTELLNWEGCSNYGTGMWKRKRKTEGTCTSTTMTDVAHYMYDLHILL